MNRDKSKKTYATIIHRKLKIVKILIIFKLIYRFYVMPIKTLSVFFL